MINCSFLYSKCISSDHTLLHLLGLAYLSPPGLDHELVGKVGSRLGLQRTNDNALVQWIPGNDLGTRISPIIT